MSKLDAIFICGIRSFPIEDTSGQKFSFFSPLTLFQGQNGCGKTTILEAIRFACTGELPGGPKSGPGFVSDPYMHSVLHVLGQIKLKIFDVRGNPAVITRVIKSEKTQTASGLKFSTVDTMVKYVKANGMSEERSGRTADINAVIVELMGVSPAILNNVIFCHQEQSLWPLGECAQLKKKFDEIFDLTNYNKSVDMLRKEVKSKMVEQKVLGVKVDHHRELKDEVEKKKVNLRDKEKKLDKQKSDIEGLESRLIPIDARLVEISDLETNFLELENKKSAKENEIKNLVQIQDNIKKNLQEEFGGSDEELQKEIGSFDTLREGQKRCIAEAEGERAKLQKAETEAGDLVTKKSTKLVRVQEEKKTYDNKVLELRQGIVNLGTQLKCDGLEEAEAVAALKILKCCLEEEKKKLNQKLQDVKKANNEKQQAIDKAYGLCVQTDQEKRLKSEEVNTCKKQLRDLELKLKDLDVCDEQLKSYQKSLEKIDKDLESLTKDFNEAKVTKDIDNDKKRIKQLDAELDDLERDYKTQQKNSVIDNEMENLKRDVSMWKNEIEKRKHKHSDEFKMLFTELPGSDLQKAVTEKINEANRTVAKLTKEVNAMRNAATKMETQCGFEEKELRTMEAELKQSQKEIAKFCGDVGYEEKCNDLDSSIKLLQRKKGQCSSAKILFEKFVEDMNEKKCCPVCSTDFSSKHSAVAEVVNSIQEKIKDIPSELEKVEGELSKQEVLYKKLIELKSVNKKINDLSKSLPEKQQKIEEMKKDCSAKKDTFEELNKEIKPLQEITVTGTKIISEAALIDRYGRDIKLGEAKLTNLGTQLIELETTRSLIETETAITDLKDDLASLREKCEKAQQRLNATNKRLQSLRDNRNTVFQKQLDLQKDMQGKPQLLERIQEVGEREKALAEQIEALDELAISQKMTLEEVKYEMEMLTAKSESELESARNEYNRHSNNLSDIEKIHNSVKHLSADDLEKRFNDILTEIQELKSKKDELITKKNELTEKINNIKLEVASEELHFRNLRDNAELREKRKQQSVVDAELQELKRKIGKQNFRTVFQEKGRLNTEKMSIERERQMKIGEKAEMEKQILEIREDLNRPSNLNVYTEYRNLFTRHKVMDTAIANMKKYAESLENAICIYHKKRMEKINNHIRELWINIYRGSDIDYIRIDTDMTFVGGRRNYRYQVMQKKNDILLEMRGRCSAGQKVLASLIIRMALAETFSSNCGILALDEPTTNLDCDNARSLSNALVNIINSRLGQKHFQLLIITHDETFLHHLRGVNNMKQYYKVQRNVKNQSIVQKELLV